MDIKEILSRVKNIEENLTCFLSKRNNKRVLYVLFVIISFVLIYMLNIQFPLYADDWGYSFIWGGGPLENFFDVLRSQYEHYFTWGGRSVAHIIAQTLLLLGSKWADFLNSFIYVFFVYKIYSIANIKNELNPTLFFFINILIWFFQPAFASTILWITGSANYLWCTTIIIIFIYPYCSLYLKQNKSKRSLIKNLIMFFLGILAGWTNENTALGLLFVVVIIILMSIEKPNWTIWGLVGAISGYILMLIAPGNFVRYDSVVSNNSLIEQSKIAFYLSRLYPVIGDFYRFALVLMFIYAILLILFLFYGKTKDSKIIYLSLFFIIGGIVSDIVMVVSPEFPSRAWFGIITFFIIAIAIIYASLNMCNKFIRLLNYVVVVFSLMFFLQSYRKNLKDLTEVNIVFKHREDIINEETDKKKFDFIVSETINQRTNFVEIDEIPSDSDHWINQFYVRFYGIKSFKVQKEN